MPEPRKILIGGAARSGKTKLARALGKELHCPHLPLDALVSAFEKHFPETGIVHEQLEWSRICANFLPFLSSFLDELKFSEIPYVFDTYHITPEGAAMLRKTQGVTVLFLGFPNIEEQLKLKCIREFKEAHDWTDQKADQSMLELIQKFKLESQVIQAECEKFNIPFFDSGIDFDGALSRAHNWVVKGGA